MLKYRKSKKEAALISGASNIPELMSIEGRAGDTCALTGFLGYCVKEAYLFIYLYLKSQVENVVSDGMREFTSQHPELLNQYLEFMRAKIGGV